jgi:hypothetical protein
MEVCVTHWKRIPRIIPVDTTQRLFRDHYFIKEKKFENKVLEVLFPEIAAYSTLCNPEVTETRYEIYRITLICKRPM